MKFTTILLLLSCSLNGQDALDVERLRHTDRLLKTMIRMDIELDSFHIGRERLKSQIDKVEYVLDNKNSAMSKMEAENTRLYRKLSDQADSTDYYKVMEHKWRVENRYSGIAKDELKRQRNWLAIAVTLLTGLIGYLIK